MRYLLLLAGLMMIAGCANTMAGRRADDGIIKKQVQCTTTRSCNRGANG